MRNLPDWLRDMIEIAVLTGLYVIIIGVIGAVGAVCK